MTTRVVSLTPTPDPGDTLLLDGRPTVVLYRLPGRNPPVRVTGDLPCGTCQSPVRYDAVRCRWWCPSCRVPYDRTALADLARVHGADGGRGGS